MSATSPAFGYTLPPFVQSLVDGFQERRARTTSDRSLCRRIQAEVGRMEPQPSGLTFQVHDAAVSVYGIVASPERQREVLAAAATQPGARRIVDHLTIADA